MLQLSIPEFETFDEEKQEFLYSRKQSIALEHSLISISKWESKWHKPFLKKEEKTLPETRHYIKCMTVTSNVESVVYDFIFSSSDLLDKINEYIQDPMTATWFSDSGDGKPKNSKFGPIITSEIIYYWMVAFNIPFECEKWHINRLLTLIQVCEAKSQKPKKMDKKAVMERNRRLNEQRKAQYNTRG